LIQIQIQIRQFADPKETFVRKYSTYAGVCIDYGSYSVCNTGSSVRLRSVDNKHLRITEHSRLCNKHKANEISMKQCRQTMHTQKILNKKYACPPMKIRH